MLNSIYSVGYGLKFLCHTRAVIALLVDAKVKQWHRIDHGNKMAEFLGVER